MMRARLNLWLESPQIAYVAAAVSLVIGLFFVFVWAPHPWGWHGIDQYHELARALARGEAFSTTDVPWGYAYFVAAFYAVFGDRAWIPVTAQVVLNATVPVLLYELVSGLASRRVAAIAALLVGVLSFNTIYASTESSDSICTVLFIASLLCFQRGHQRTSVGLMAVSGLLAGTVPQFRPNMILFPLVLAGAYIVAVLPRRRSGLLMTAFLAMVVVALSPWVIRNYALTGAILPTSTHGGVQLWYGTLQSGPYLESRAYNPRAIFEAASFDYTSIANQPILVTAERHACADPTATVALVYRTDRNSVPARVASGETEGAALSFAIPGQPSPTAVYYHFETEWRDASGNSRRQTTPDDADAAPFVYFVTGEHLRDLDTHGDLLDIFDLVRVLRHLAWHEPLGDRRTDADGNGDVDERDLRLMVVRLLGDGATVEGSFQDPALAGTDDSATLRLADGSTLAVPRTFSGAVTDLVVHGALAGSLLSARRAWHVGAPRAAIDSCHVVWNVRANEVFYRKEPHQMQRYIALAMDNIKRDPGAFAAASLYRMARLFVIRGTDDPKTTQQFVGSSTVYLIGLVLSVVHAALFAGGVAIAWRSRSRLLMLLLPIVYVPVTICFVLTNMRYTITVQPLMFAFVALTIATVLPAGDAQDTTA